MPDYGQRAALNFQASRDVIGSEVKGMLAEHSAKGLLRSGATLKRSVQIFEHASSNALGQSLDEVAKLIDHRGRAWRKAISQISEALENHIAEAPAILSKPLQMGGGDGDSDAGRAVRAMLAECADRLRRQLADFSQGWTAPKPEKWKDRHPNLDRLVFLLIGAAVTAGAAIIQKAL